MLPSPVLTISRRISSSGGRALLVGGYVRDHLLGLEPKDLDVEVFGLPLERVEAILSESGEVITVGRAFGVLRVKGLDVDFSLPRLDSKVGDGHKGFEVRTDPSLTFAEAARRRDLTINSMALDPLTGEILDPHGGRRDLEARVLRAVDSTHFAEDPLRGVRVGQLAARFEMSPNAELRTLCRQLDLSELSGERILEEMRKLLLKGRRPSLGLRVFEDFGYLRYSPELAALPGVPQDPEWHPEGDVWVHTLMVVDEAATLRDGGPDDEALMFGALCHDLGKPSTTVEERGRVRSPAHDVAGVPLARTLLERWRAPNELIARTAALVEHHLAPALFIKGDAGPHGYRRLARKLGAANVTVELLVRLARADHLGRTTPEALARDCSVMERFLARAQELLIVREAPRDVVLGRHLIARGMRPGPRFGEILARCRDVQDETGSTDPEEILARVLGADGVER
jgi:tRNA nucleotidyltransferase (CCA-adding enzyme)